MQDRSHHRASAFESRNTRFGLVLFAVYVIFYALFVYLSAFRADIMARPMLGGVNLAVIYGFGLIAAAFLLAMIYMYFCRPINPDAKG